MREARALSQGQLAAKLGVHRPYLNGIERGARNPSLKTISKIATSLAVDLSTLFQDGRSSRRFRRAFFAGRGKRGARPVHARFGQRIQRLREARGWSVAQLAKRSGFPTPYIAGVEQGAKNPSLLRMARIAKALNAVLVECFR
jgi:transcriptional regulator with XRE-family HTH domain